MGLWHLRRGEFDVAEEHFREAITRLTRRNPNPYDGEPHYNLGLCLRYQYDALPLTPSLSPSGGEGARRAGEGARLFDEAYAAFYKAIWNQAWVGAAYHALAEIDCCRQEWVKACEHAQRACQASPLNQRAMNLWARALKKCGNASHSETLLRDLRRRDPLDWWTRHLLGEELHCDLQKRRRAKQLLTTVLKRDPNHALAADLLADFATRR